jgi:phytol kinase
MAIAKKDNYLERVDNLNRKIIHVLSAIIIFFFPYFLSLGQIIFLSLLFSVLFLVSRYLKFLPIINKVRRLSWGEVLYPLGIMIAAIFFLPENILAFQFGVLVLGFSDSLANILGDLFGRHALRTKFGTKSLEGSLVFFITTVFILIIFSGGTEILFLGPYLLIAFLITISEFALFFGLDNLVLPALSAYLFSLL